MSNKFPDALPDQPLSPKEARREIAALENVEWGSVLRVTREGDRKRVGYMLVVTADAGRWRVRWCDGWHVRQLSP